jgi:crotonobetainyl-CoA:carnitine CoA-transferase CaiB-like acyl-CoA transferase
VPCGPYLAPEQLTEDPQLRDRGFFTQADPGEGTGGLFPGSPWHIEGWGGVAHVAAPQRPTSETAEAS